MKPVIRILAAVLVAAAMPALAETKWDLPTQAWLPKNAVIVNKRAFDALDKPAQQAVLKAAAMLADRLKKAGPEGRKVIDAYRALQ